MPSAAASTATLAAGRPRRRLRWRILQRVVLHTLLVFCILLLGALLIMASKTLIVALMVRHIGAAPQVAWRSGLLLSVGGEFGPPGGVLEHALHLGAGLFHARCIARQQRHGAQPHVHEPRLHLLRRHLQRAPLAVDQRGHAVARLQAEAAGGLGVDAGLASAAKIGLQRQLVLARSHQPVADGHAVHALAAHVKLSKGERSKLAELAACYHFSFFEHWITDVVGHRGDLAEARRVLLEMAAARFAVPVSQLCRVRPPDADGRDGAPALVVHELGDVEVAQGSGPWTQGMLPQLAHTQSADTLLLAHPEMPAQRIA